MYVLGGLFAKRFLRDWSLKTAFKTLLVGTVFTGLYTLILVWSGASLLDDLSKWFMSYTVATTFYELLLKEFMKRIGISVKKEDPTK